MPHVISVINLKGGVGKTTLTIALAQALTCRFGKRVLVIDLDPQTNATVMLIGDQRWREANESGRTLAGMFLSAIERTDGFDIRATLLRGVSDVKGTAQLDLLPSSLDLIDVQDRLAGATIDPFGAVAPTDILRRAVKPILGGYDIVLIDCPPSLGRVTLNGLRMSHGFLIPTIPDHLSTYGIRPIVQRVASFAREIAEDIRPVGIVATKVQKQIAAHMTVLGHLKGHPALPPLFDAHFPQAAKFAEAPEFDPDKLFTFKQKWGYGDLAEQVEEVAREFLVRIGLEP